MWMRKNLNSRWLLLLRFRLSRTDLKSCNQLCRNGYVYSDDRISCYFHEIFHFNYWHWFFSLIFSSNWVVLQTDCFDLTWNRNCAPNLSQFCNRKRKSELVAARAFKLSQQIFCQITTSESQIIENHKIAAIRKNFLLKLQFFSFQERRSFWKKHTVLYIVVVPYFLI